VRARNWPDWVAPTVALFAFALIAFAVAHAQGPILHEFVPDVRADESMILSRPGSEEPAAIVYDGEIIPAPTDGALRPDERPMSAIPGDGSSAEAPGRRSPTFRPDRVTALEGTLGYYTVFSPAIAPFKRVSALDGVALAEDDRRTPVLGVWDPATRRIRIDGATAEAPDGRPRDRFWGSVVLDFTAGRRVPLPSVSPESRILTLRTEPEIDIAIEKDGADNFFAVALRTPPSSLVRVTFLTDAPRSYFNADRIPDVRVDALGAEARRLPYEVQTSAETFARELGLSRRSTLPSALSALTQHFRSFEESSEPPHDSGDIYLDLARGMKGVCRHRAYGFVITALGLGIPARFVMNEAHAWVEVKMPELGWMRIDLGGAAEGLEAHNASDRPIYRAENPDPLPRPPSYERSYSGLRGDVTGLRSDATEAPSGSGSESSPGTESGTGGGASGDDARATSPSVATVTSGSTRARRRMSLHVDRERYEVFRGRTIAVSGRATSGAGDGLPGMRVEVLLGGDREVLLGVTVTENGGYFQGSFGVPPSLDTGEYRLLVRSPGDESYLPAFVR
jgi:transglutaminase-like putative cysteine protease